jgi:hypothetical protein
MFEPEVIENWFTYHAPGSDDLVAYEKLRNAGKEFAKAINELCPDSADKTAAIRKVREAVMTANASIACKGK